MDRAPGRRPARRPAAGVPAERDQRRRQLSQNYLRPGGADQYLRALRLDPALLTLEIGAGEGILTGRLAPLCRALIAYELDPDLAARLGPLRGQHAGLRVVTGDFLAAAPPRVPFQVVGNVPFSRTAPIVDWCLGSPRMTTATLITQLEYARKRTGGYGRWSRLTVSTWPQLQWELRATIGRAQFRPVPRVDAGVLHLARRPQPLIRPSRQAAYRRMVEIGFGGVGGSLLASLRRRYPADQLAAAFAAAGIERGTVVAFVAPEQWVELFRVLDQA